MDVQGVAHLKSVLAGLERSHRYIVLMYYADELQVEEIGLVLDLPRYRVQDVLDAFRVEVVRRVTAPTI